MRRDLVLRALPGALFTAYLATTALFFFVGPWRYPLDDIGELVAFLVAVHLAFAVGAFLGARRPGRASRWRLDVGRAAVVCLAVDFALLFPTSALNTGSWVPNPWAAFGRLGDAYLESLRLRAEAVPYVNYLRILVAPFLAAAWPLGVVYWRRIGRAGRVLMVASVVGTLALYAAMGANMAAGHWMALFPWLVLAGALSGTLSLRGRAWLRPAAVLAASIALFAFFFAATMNARHGSFAVHGQLPGIDAVLRDEKPAASEGPAASEETPAATERPVGHETTPPAAEGAAGGEEAVAAAGEEPARAAVAARGLVGYLTQGYYAVYLSLDEPWVPTWGVGHSVFLSRQAARMTGDPSLPERSYPERIEARGWNAYGYWATIYPWIASDVSFPGTVVVLFLVGWVLSAVWADSLTGENPFAVAFLGQMLIMLYYVPAHNKTMHSGEGVVAFAVLGLAWLLASRRRRGG